MIRFEANPWKLAEKVMKYCPYISYICWIFLLIWTFCSSQMFLTLKWSSLARFFTSYTISNPFPYNLSCFFFNLVPWLLHTKQIQNEGNFPSPIWPLSIKIRVMAKRLDQFWCAWWHTLCLFKGFHSVFSFLYFAYWKQRYVDQKIIAVYLRLTVLVRLFRCVLASL